MPLPWTLPTKEEADELYRRIDQLVTDLYHLVRSILFGPPPVPPRQDAVEGDDEEHNVPDLLAQLGAEPSPETDSKGEIPPKS